MEYCGVWIADTFGCGALTERKASPAAGAPPPIAPTATATATATAPPGADIPLLRSRVAMLEQSVAARHAELAQLSSPEAFNACMDQGKLAFRDADYARAAEMFERAADAARTQALARDEARALANLGNACAALGRQRAALRNYERALARLRALGEAQLESAILRNVVECCYKLGRVEAAMGYLSREVSITKALANGANGAATKSSGSFAKDRPDDAKRVSMQLMQMLRMMDSVNLNAPSPSPAGTTTSSSASATDTPPIAVSSSSSPDSAVLGPPASRNAGALKPPPPISSFPTPPLTSA